MTACERYVNARRHQSARAFEHGLDVEDGRAVERFEVADAHPGTVDLDDLDVVQADRDSVDPATGC